MLEDKGAESIMKIGKAGNIMAYYEGEMFNSVDDAIQLYKHTKNVFDNRMSDLEKTGNQQNNEAYEEINRAFEQKINWILAPLLVEMAQTAEILATAPVKDGAGVYIKDFEAMSKEQQRKIILDKMADLYCDKIPNGHCIESEYICFLSKNQKDDNVFIFNFNKARNLISIKATLFENNSVKLDEPVYSDNFKEVINNMETSITKLKAGIIDTAITYKDNAEEILKNCIAIKINHFNTEIGHMDKDLSLISDKPLFNNLLDVLELDSDYQIYQKNDIIYFIEDDDVVVRELPISKLMEGKLPTDIITDYKAEQLFNYEDIGFANEFSYYLQELLDNGLKTEYYNILKEWNDEHNDVSNDILGYYKTLCDWYNTGKIKPMTREEIDLIIPVAKDEYEAIIDAYEHPFPIIDDPER